MDQSQCNSVILRTGAATSSEKSDGTDNAANCNNQGEHYLNKTRRQDVNRYVEYKHVRANDTRIDDPLLLRNK
jgi:hypothetical protein